LPIFYVHWDADVQRQLRWRRHPRPRDHSKDQHGDALAWADPEADKHSCNALHACVEPPVGRASLGSAEQIDDRDLVRHALERMVEEIPEIALAIIASHVMMLSIVAPSVNCSITELDTRGTTRRQDGLLKGSVQDPRTMMTLWRKGDMHGKYGAGTKLKVGTAAEMSKVTYA
jgi:hypothetical protein